MNDNAFIYLEDHPELGMINTSRLAQIIPWNYNMDNMPKPYAILFRETCDGKSHVAACYDSMAERDAALASIMETIGPTTIKPRGEKHYVHMLGENGVTMCGKYCHTVIRSTHADGVIMEYSTTDKDKVTCNECLRLMGSTR